MPWKRKCKDCGAIDDTVSSHALCIKCAGKRIRIAGVEMKTKSGPAWNAWRVAMKRAMKAEGVE